MTGPLTVDIVDPGCTATIQASYGVKLHPSLEHWAIFENWVMDRIIGGPLWSDDLPHSSMRYLVQQEMLTSYNADLEYYVDPHTGATIGARIVFSDREQLTAWVLQWS